MPDITLMTMGLDPGDTGLTPTEFSERVVRFVDELKADAEFDPGRVLLDYAITVGDLKDDSVLTMLGARIIREAYANGTCRLCGGQARPCALRHTKGRSCD